MTGSRIEHYSTPVKLALELLQHSPILIPLAIDQPMRPPAGIVEIMEFRVNHTDRSGKRLWNNFEAGWVPRKGGHPDRFRLHTGE